MMRWCFFSLIFLGSCALFITRYPFTTVHHIAVCIETTLSNLSYNKIDWRLESCAFCPIKRNLRSINNEPWHMSCCTYLSTLAQSRCTKPYMDHIQNPCPCSHLVYVEHFLSQFTKKNLLLHLNV